MKLENFLSSSHALQDAFALDVCGENKRWLEVGACFPDTKGSNTALLELKGWTGISIEIDPLFKKLWDNSWRNSNALIIADAIQFNYSSLENKHFNYVQLDVEPPNITYQCLEKILNAGITFDCLTFEHDLYANPKGHIKYKIDAFELLNKHGYKRVIESVRRIDMPKIDFEDWYVANYIDFPNVDFWTWAKTAFGKYCKQGRPLLGCK